MQHIVIGGELVGGTWIRWPDDGADAEFRVEAAALPTDFMPQEGMEVSGLPTPAETTYTVNYVVQDGDGYVVGIGARPGARLAGE